MQANYFSHLFQRFFTFNSLPGLEQKTIKFDSSHLVGRLCCFVFPAFPMFLYVNFSINFAFRWFVSFLIHRKNDEDFFHLSFFRLRTVKKIYKMRLRRITNLQKNWKLSDSVSNFFYDLVVTPIFFRSRNIFSNFWVSDSLNVRVHHQNDELYVLCDQKDRPRVKAE